MPDAGQELGEQLGEEVTLLDLLDQLEEVGKDDDAEVLRLVQVIGAKVAKSEEDRDTLGSFGGIGSICERVQHAKFAGPLWTTFLTQLPGMCSRSPFNRVTLKDNGITDAVVDQLRAQVSGFTAENQAERGHIVHALCTGVTALCRADDENKRCVARIRKDLNEEGMTANARTVNVGDQAVLVDDGQVPLFNSSEGGLHALLALLEVPSLEPRLQLAAFRALRAVASDDDSRQSTCAPAAVENREFLTCTMGPDGGRWRTTRNVIVLAMAGTPSRPLAEAALGIIKEVCWAQDKIFQLVYEDGILPRILALTKREDYAESMAKMVMIVLRQFCFSDEMKTLCAFETDALTWTCAMVKRHTQNEKLCEQAFGLFSNMTIRMPDVAAHLADENRYDVLSMAHTILHTHPNSPDMLRTVVQTIRNLSKVPDALASIQESVLLDELRELVASHREDPKWRDVLEISKQFLRELRSDDGLRNAPQYNEYY